MVCENYNSRSQFDNDYLIRCSNEVEKFESCYFKGMWKTKKRLQNAIIDVYIIRYMIFEYKTTKVKISIAIHCE